MYIYINWMNVCIYTIIYTYIHPINVVQLLVRMHKSIETECACRHKIIQEIFCANCTWYRTTCHHIIQRSTIRIFTRPHKILNPDTKQHSAHTILLRIESFCAFSPQSRYQATFCAYNPSAHTNILRIQSSIQIQSNILRIHSFCAYNPESRYKAHTTNILRIQLFFATTSYPVISLLFFGMFFFGEEARHHFRF